MNRCTTAHQEGQDGLFFLPEIDNLSDLSKEAFAVMLGRGAWAGASLERQTEAYAVIDERRRQLNGAEVLGLAETI